jgi:hypothetical protein
MKILVFTPMKVGSTTLFNHLRRLPGFGGRFFRAVRGKCFRDNLVVKAHHCSLKTFSHAHQLHWDIIFTIVRKPTDMYVSRYFHDFKKRKVPLAKLVDDFLAVRWETRTNANYEAFRDSILEYAGVDILDGKMDRTKGYHIYQGRNLQTGQPVRVCILRIDRLQEAFLNEIYGELGLPGCPRLQNKNQAHKRWYGKLYSEFRTLLPSAYYERFRQKDEMIQRLFWENDSPGLSE